MLHISWKANTYPKNKISVVHVETSILKKFTLLGLVSSYTLCLAMVNNYGIIVGVQRKMECVISSFYWMVSSDALSRNDSRTPRHIENGVPF